MKSKDVSWDIGQTVVDGTITSPDEPGTFPGVIFIAGSGPTDRNWETPLLPGSNGTARILAERLARHGYVTMRYDKRITGPHAQHNLPFLSGHISLESHFEELNSAYAILLKQEDVDPDQIFVLTNSEGTLHALYYQLHAGVQPFRGMVLTGVPGRPLNEVTRTQVVSQLQVLPNATTSNDRYDLLIRRFEEGAPFVPDPQLPEQVNNLVAALSTPVNQPFTREFWSFNASTYLTQITVPVLVVIGKKDIQVDWELDGEALAAATINQHNITFFLPDNANHVLKYEPRPRGTFTAEEAILNYNASDSKIDPQTFETILGWLDEHQI
jgi:uncharacterized protein